MPLTWNAVSPDPAKSVEDNTVPMQENTTFVESAISENHFFYTDVTKLGLHTNVQSPNYDGGAGIFDPTLHALANGSYYVRKKTVAEVPVGALDSQPYFSNAASQFMQILGIRAMCLFTSTGAIGVKPIIYSHNISTVTKTAVGQYTIAFATALPTVNYFVVAGGQLDGVSSIPIVHLANTGVVGAKTVNQCMLKARDISVPPAPGSNPFVFTIDPAQTWVVIFGG